MKVLWDRRRTGNATFVIGSEKIGASGTMLLERVACFAGETFQSSTEIVMVREVVKFLSGF